MCVCLCFAVSQICIHFLGDIQNDGIHLELFRQSYLIIRYSLVYKVLSCGTGSHSEDANGKSKEITGYEAGYDRGNTLL